MESEKGPLQLEQAIRFLSKSQEENPQKPFFLYFAPQAPHHPYHPAESISGIDIAGTSISPRADLVVQFDVILGLLVRQLGTLGIEQDTLIIVTSDNGPLLTDKASGHKANGGFKGFKGSNYEAGHRGPFIASWGARSDQDSRIKPNTSSDHLIGLQDLMATLADLVDAPIPDGQATDSISFLSSLLDASEGESARASLVHHSASGDFAIRQGQWKLLVDPDEPTADKLFDLQMDRREQFDVRGEFPEIARSLKSALEKERLIE